MASRRRFLATLSAAAVGAAAGCAATDDGTTPDGAGTTGGATTGTGTSDGTAGGGGQTTTAGGDDVRVETVATDLVVPWGTDVLDGTRYLTERPGRVGRLTGGGYEVVADLTATTEHTGEAGLLGLAFHPDGGSAYVYQTTREGGRFRNRILRLSTGDWSVAETVLDGVPAARLHDGGRLHVGPDGALYVTTGDATNGRNAQDRDSLAGKVLRLALDGSPHPDNPFGTAVYTYGHRNPQGLAFHPASGDLYSTEHGPASDDEVNVLLPGRNYGWPVVTGRSDGDRFTDPIATWTPTIAPAGAAFYAGAIPGWGGDLVFGCLAGQRLQRVGVDPAARRAASTTSVFEGRFGRLRTTWTDGDALYVVTSNRDGRGSPRAGDDRVLRVTPG